ncbi:AAA family ATPase [Bradyrhizobium sp. CCGUVB23]|uniref:ATP-binding protein n=1 Tax=Bradyrhizobium sp. CCGUVB23 TaxID=2949630 RepID=UPI0020B17F4D|nr:adenylate/guanylate cyclase domain-containing protein [Bradyrhizobium sp. CCGUVB23]MCP3462644.1 AAA family ATPase [Bradyrhizobium sp. CCGUVB23]
MSQDINTWLRALGLGQYCDVFAAGDVDLRVLPHLTETDLRELGVSLGHRKIILAAVAESFGGPLSAANTDSLHANDKPLPRAPPERPPERRLLSVLFCDLVGSTELSRRLDPEDLREVLRSYQDRVAGAVTRYGGYVAKFIGDGVMAYFGWPCAYEDHAERAVRAGLEALAAVQLLKPDAIELEARVGVATGLVVVGDLVGSAVREEGAVAGETPNLAARLQASARPSQLVIAEATRRLIADAFVVEDRGEKPLKGFGTGIHVYLVKSEREVESRFHAAHAGELSPFVGRVHEVELLVERWELARAGEGQAILLSGDAGIGKSRLVQAFTEKLGATPNVVLRFQCSPYHTHSTLFPIVQNLGRAADFRPGDSNDQRLDKLEHILAEVGADIRTVAPVYAELLSLDFHDRYDKTDLTPQQRKSLTLQTLVDRFLQRATRTPVLIIVEDAHWIDPTTTELLDALMAPINRAPIMLLVTHRPSWTSEWPSLYGHVLSLSLGPLAKPQIADMVRHIAGATASARLIDEIVGRTDGVPLFIEELARSLVERGAGAGEFEVRLPATLQGSLMARLDRCQPTAKETAQIASVIGREFSRDLLARVCDFPADDLDAAVAELMAAHLVLRGGPSEDALAFRHALIQDTAYQSLLTSRRQRYHAAIARALAEYRRETADTQPELVARHFSEAGLPQLALPFWRRAGERALARSANYEAIDHYGKALAIAERLPDAEGREDAVLETRIALGRAQSAAGHLQQASDTFERAAGEARARGSSDALANCAIGFAQARFYYHSIDPSIALLLEALSAIEGGDSRQRCQILSALGRGFLMKGDFARADIFNSEAIEMARRLEDDRSLCEVLFTPFLGPTALSGTQPADLRNRLSEALAIADRLNDADLRTRILSVQIYYSAEFGDYQGMIAALDTFQSAIEGRQMLHQEWVAQLGRAMQALLIGDFPTAERLAENAYAIGRRTHGESAEGVYGVQMFTIRREQGRLAEIAPVIKHLINNEPDGNTWKPGFALVATELGFKPQAQKMLDELRQTDFAFPMDAKRSTTLSYLADVCAALEDGRCARALYDLLEPYRHMTVTAGIATVCYGSAGRFLGALADMLGDWDRSEEHFEEALRMDRHMHASPWLAHAQHRYARMLRRRGRHGDIAHADALLNESLATASRLNMTALLTRLRGQLH